MSASRRRPGLRLARSRAALLISAALVGSGLTVLTAIGSAQATTTVSPTEPGTPPVVRGGAVDISVDTGARSFYRTSGGSFAPVAGGDFLLNTRTCRGDNPTLTGPNGQGNSSPRDRVVVTGPDGEVVLDQTSAVRNISIAGALTSPSYQPASPQPAPSGVNYRGDLSDSGAYHGFPLSLDLDGKPGGIYTVTTTTSNMVRVGGGILQVGGACTVGTPTGNQTFAPGPVVETQQFEYRPWDATFTDLLRGGDVTANVSPREFAFSVGSKSSGVIDGSQAQAFYSFDGSFLLPGDPAACAADPSTCLPASAELCDPDAGCDPRLMIINRPGSTGLVGVFDLDTRAFIAGAQIDGTKRVLFSLGTDNDGLYNQTLQQLSDALGAQGVDLATILGTEVIVSNGQNQTSLSLLNGLQIDPATAPGGISITRDATVQAGVILDIYSSLRTGGESCLANSASSSDEVDRYTPGEDNGYTVTKTDFAPEVPGVGPLAAIVGGPIYHITGRFNDDALVNVATAPIGIDTAVDEPNGYPVWISPFVSGINTASPRNFDFVGTATWSASESPVPVLGGCLVVDFMLGTGVAVLNNPLPVGLGTLIDLTGQPNAGAAAFFESVDATVTDAVNSLTTNPTVDMVLGLVLDGLALPELPTTP